MDQKDSKEESEKTTQHMSSISITFFGEHAKVLSYKFTITVKNREKLTEWD
jgi:hypothetical protein